MVKLQQLLNTSSELKLENGYLSLNGKSIGRLSKFTDVGDRIIYDKVLDEDKHTFRKNDSFGLCWALIEAFQDDDVVRIQTQKRYYVLTAKEIKQHGDFLWFKHSGFERQIFVPKGFWRAGL